MKWHLYGAGVALLVLATLMTSIAQTEMMYIRSGLVLVAGCVLYVGGAIVDAIGELK